MTTIRQFIQTSPTKAMELFSRLAETSDTAVKTRERLFGQLKDELELAASLEEQHLFPVLKKHKETKELVQEALSDNKQTRKLLTELEHTAKDDEQFIPKVLELRKSFQQHVRDEKKELLPAVLKALSDEEAETILANIENEKAQIEAAKEAAQRMQAVAQSSTALVRGLQEVSRAYFEMTQDRFQKNVEAFAAFSLCRSVPEFVEAQTTLVRQNVDLTLENGQRLAQLSVQVIEEATHTVAVERG